MARGNFFRTLRQLILLIVLLFVATGSYLARSRSTDWNEPLWVAMYPINADGRQVTRDYIETLAAGQFADIEQFMERETRRYGVDISRPVRIDVGRPVETLPPEPPADGNPVSIAMWSIKLRWWARQVTRDQPGATPDIRLFLVYHDPETNPEVPDSLGLQKGLIGVVHVFAKAAQRRQNNFVIAHEMMHTLGASDKYSLRTNLPIYPFGYAEPDKAERYPQRFAEIMGGRIPLSPTEAVMPESLQEARVGPGTALEIRWIDSLEKAPVALAGADGQIASN